MLIGLKVVIVSTARNCLRLPSVMKYYLCKITQGAPHPQNRPLYIFQRFKKNNALTLYYIIKGLSETRLKNTQKDNLLF